jgi:integrase
MEIGDFKLLVKEHPSGRVFLTIYYKAKRFRYSNASVIGRDIFPNKRPQGQRREHAEYLRSAFIQAIYDGWEPERSDESNTLKPKTFISLLEWSYQRKSQGPISEKYKRDLGYTIKYWRSFLKAKRKERIEVGEVDASLIADYLEHSSGSMNSRRSLLRNSKALLMKPGRSVGLDVHWDELSFSKPTSTLHKPIKDIPRLLSEIEEYNAHLHLCCLLAYGCMLRPHREIRELRWGDFSQDLSFISLSGGRNKGKRNRIVPIPAFVLPYLKPSHPSHNIFTGTENPYNPDYFKTLWGKFKRRSSLLEIGQTLYSFRHTGAMNFF